MTTEQANGYNDSAEADARIIAAAPAMLAALEAILAIEVRADGLRGSGMVDDSDLKALRVCAGQARRVLALARGKVK